MPDGNVQLAVRALGATEKERIVNMRVMGIPDHTIMDVVGATSEVYQAFITSPEYQQSFGELAYKKSVEVKDIDDLWDKIERQALTNLDASLAWNKAGDFNLKVAAVASKASRRMSPHNRPLNADGGSGRITLNLGINYVQRINSSTPDGMKDVTTSTVSIKKRVDVLPQDRIQDILGAPTTELEAQLDEIFSLDNVGPSE